MKTLLAFLISLSLGAAEVATPKEAYKKSEAGDAVIIDVREAEEIRSGMIKGAVWFPVSKFESEKNWKDEFLATTKGKEVFLYCRTGNRSGKIQSKLKQFNIESENLGGYESLKLELPTKVPKESKL